MSVKLAETQYRFGTGFRVSALDFSFTFFYDGKMFSGIIRHFGEVISVVRNEGGAQLGVQSDLFLSDCSIGDSISISGTCLTVTRIEKLDSSASSYPVAWFDLASETLRVTTLAQTNKGDTVNLERSLRLGDSLDGHLVQGHVDGTAQLCARAEENGNTLKYEFSIPANLGKFFVPKGAVTIDGVSLTVGEVTDKTFTVYIIPQTVRWTTLGQSQVGDFVNIEVDCIAKYLSRLAIPYLS